MFILLQSMQVCLKDGYCLRETSKQEQDLICELRKCL